jgi:hypothetical protein
MRRSAGWLAGWATRGTRFLWEASKSDKVPNLVADREELARFCDASVKKQLAKGGRVTAARLYPSKLPFEFSTSRTGYCDPWAEATAQGKWFVCLRAGRVRVRLPRAWVVASKPPPEHAEILLPSGSARFQRFKSKADLKAHATAWSQYTEQIEALAEIASDPDKTFGRAD